MKKVLTIAGSDASGGAGIQADIKTIAVHKMYAMSVITALTAQNTTGVFKIWKVPPEFVAEQMDAVFTDIVPDSVKIGMVPDGKTAAVIAEKIKQYHVKKIVIDPVLVSTSGCRLLRKEDTDVFVRSLFPLGTVITPNIPEAETLSGIRIRREEDMAYAAEKIAVRLNVKGAVLIKGGHLEKEEASDLLYENGKLRWYRSRRVDNPNAHGTGCTLSSAIACGLAGGKVSADAVQNAKEYLTGALNAGLNLGKGQGPLDHTYCINQPF